MNKQSQIIKHTYSAPTVSVEELKECDVLMSGPDNGDVEANRFNNGPNDLMDMVLNGS